MKEQEIKVNVEGLSASGKSCVMFEIYKALKMTGFDIEIDFTDQIDYANEVDFMKQMLKNEKKRIAGVKEKSKIILKEFGGLKK